MLEDEVTIRSSVDLAGVLCRPEHGPPGEPVPALLLLGGSGADTRDGDLAFLRSEDAASTPAPGTLRRIAHHLAHHDLASLRWDRRGSGASGGQPEGSDYTTDLEDATACFAWLAGQPGIDPSRIGVAGHSAGALTACHLCRDVPEVAAVALLGALASPIEDLLRWNVERAGRHWGDLTAEQRAAILREAPDEVRPGHTVEALLDGARRGQDVVHVEGGGRAWDLRTARLRQDLDTSYADEMRHVSCPVLILHGGDDLNVRVEDALTSYRMLRTSGNDRVELVVLPGLEHYFNPVSPDPALRIFERLSRRVLRRPMSTRALDMIAGWAARTLGVGDGNVSGASEDGSA